MKTALSILAVAIIAGCGSVPMPYWQLPDDDVVTLGAQPAPAPPLPGSPTTDYVWYILSAAAAAAGITITVQLRNRNRAARSVPPETPA